jgi:hypothetical protein
MLDIISEQLTIMLSQKRELLTSLKTKVSHLTRKKNFLNQFDTKFPEWIQTSRYYVNSINQATELIICSHEIKNNAMNKNPPS